MPTAIVGPPMTKAACQAAGLLLAGHGIQSDCVTTGVVDGTYYLPGRGALMSDGSAYLEGFLKPIAVVGRRFELGTEPSFWLDSPHTLVLGMDPDDPRPPWELVGAQAGILAAGTRAA